MSDFNRVRDELRSARREIDERAQREGLDPAEVNELKVRAAEDWERRNPRRPLPPFMRARPVRPDPDTDW